jgi:vanillate O-demethylase monooxygenase subunit
MITAQHEAIRRNPGAPMLPLGIDAALVRYRKLLEEAVRREQPPQVKAAPSPL